MNRSLYTTRRRAWLLLAPCLLSCVGCQAVRGLIGGGGGLGGLLGGGGGALGGPLGILLTLITLPAQLPNPFEAELSASPTPSSVLKAVLPVPLTTQFTATELATITQQPVAAALRPQDGFVYYTEKATGWVRKLDPATGAIDPAPVIDLHVNSSGTRGLNGIAFSADGLKMFVTYVRSTLDSDTTTEPEGFKGRIASFDFPPGAETVLADFSPRDPSLPFPADINGIGTCMVGADGKLYVSHGDYNTRIGAQDFITGNPAGKIMRLNQDGTIPADNPLPGNRFFAWGFRDPFGFNFDSANGTMWVADRGYGRHDELDIALGGANYGWPLIHGSVDTNWESQFTLNPLFFRDPAVDFSANNPQPDPRSLVVMRSNPYGAELEGSVVYAHSTLFGSPLRSKVSRIAFDIANPVVLWSDLWQAPAAAGRVVALVTRADGRLIVLCQEKIYRLDPVP